MYLVYDNATHNVLAEYETFHEAEQRRISLIGANPVLAENVEVIDFDRALEHEDAVAAAANREAQPA